jgi:uncharacterized protein (TIGR02588 family)
MSSQDQQGRNQEEEDQRHHTPAEWTTLLLSALLILAVTGAVAYFSLTGGNQPAAFTAEPGDAELREEQFYLPVTVTNTGDEPAQDVRVRVELRTDDAIETAVFTLELLPAGATEEGTAIFASDPAQGEVTAAVESFL